jgi:ABC-type nitrate/sulfonate/bicarbonate transport system permease component
MSAARTGALWSERAISILSPLVLLGLWEICARTGIVDVRFFPAPSNIIGHLFELASSGALWRHVGASLYRLAAGFIVGCVPAIVIGLAIGR